MARSLGARIERVDGVVRRCGDALASGWLFFVPYLLLFVVWRVLPLPVSVLRAAFLALHAGWLVVACVAVWRRWTTLRLPDLLFWQGLFLLFLLPGAYLEFPSDPWEHVRRIFAWEGVQEVGRYPGQARLTYFFGWTLIGDLPPTVRRLALDLLSAFWQLLLAVNVYAFARRLGFDRAWGKVQVLATVCFAGVSVFGLYRYYALSATPLAYVAYLQALILVLDVADRRPEARRWWWQLPLLVMLILVNHRQALLWLMVSILAVALAWVLARPRHRRAVLIGLPTLAVVGVAFGLVAVAAAPRLGWERWRPQGFFLSPWGSFRIWEWRGALPYEGAIGALGLLGVALALFALIGRRRDQRLALLTLMPYALLLFPPFAFLFSIGYSHPNLTASYRVLYAMPATFMVVATLRAAFERLGRSSLPGRARRLAGPVLAAFLIAVPAMWPAAPVFGKLWFQVHRPDPLLTGAPLDETAEWFEQNYRMRPPRFAVGDLGYLHRDPFHERKLARSCALVTDGTSSFLLASYFGLPALTDRVGVPSLEGLTFDDLLSPTYICAVLLPDPLRVPVPPTSEVAASSGHWKVDNVQEDFEQLIDVNALGVVLEGAGWRKHYVPPFYILFTRTDPCSNPKKTIFCDAFETRALFQWSLVTGD